MQQTCAYIKLGVTTDDARPMTLQQFHASGLNANITPFAFQHYARDFYSAFKKHQGGPPFSPARLFLLSRSIELAAKALHFQAGATSDGVRDINHDLEAACGASTLAKFGVVLTTQEVEELSKANAYYKGKGFEYFLFKHGATQFDRSGPQMALAGWPDLPDETVLEALLKRLLNLPP
jgi:hypothetical protein